MKAGKIWRVLPALFLLLGPVLPCVHAQGTAFTYQGMLQVNGSPANGNYDVRFGLYTNNGGGNPVSFLITNAGMPVANGLLAVTLDFRTVFNGGPYWLEIGARVGGSSSNFTTLSPRQALSAAPYAVTATNLTGTLPAAQLTGTLPTAVYPATLPALNGMNLTNLAMAGAAPASATNQGAVTQTGFAMMNMLPSVQLTATPFKTPPMGWMSWNCCGTDGARESNCLSMASNMVKYGLPALGYNLVQIDAGWQGYRDANGFIHENTNRFPDGMSNMVATLHSMGIKVGIFEGINLTNIESVFAADNEAAMFNTNFSNEQELMNDVQTFVNWGIDYVKLEGGTNGFITEDQERRWYEIFVTTAQNAGKPLYIMGAVGDECSPWMYGVINARRSGAFDMGDYDFTPACFTRFLGNFWHAAAHPEYAGPGCFQSLDAIPDADPADPTYMLMTAMMNGELIWSWFDPYGFYPPSNAAYLTNVIQIDQDPAALVARSVLTNGTVTVWKKPLGGPASSTVAVAFFNTATNGAPVSTSVSLQSLGVFGGQFTCLDLISNVTTVVSNTISANVPPMTAFGYKLSPYTPPAIASPGTNYTASINDRTILVSASAQTVTLPTASGNAGLSLTIKLTVSGYCTVAAAGSQKIDGGATYTLSAQYKYVTVESDGTQWWVVANN